MKTLCVNGTFVETWWDAKSRNYITQLKDDKGHQIGDADFAGDKEWSQQQHREKIESAGGKRKMTLDNGPRVVKTKIDGASLLELPPVKKKPLKSLKQLKKADVKLAPPPVSKFNIGDVVRLTASALRSSHWLLEDNNFPWAVIIEPETLILTDGWKLSREMAGTLFWESSQLVRIGKHKEGERITETVTRTFKRVGFIPSNFSVEQAAAIKEMEDAMEALEKVPLRQKKLHRVAREHLWWTFIQLKELGIADCLTPHEIEVINKCQ